VHVRTGGDIRRLIAGPAWLRGLGRQHSELRRAGNWGRQQEGLARTHVLEGGSCWTHHDPTEDGDHGESE
jgi:hypothetical protein